MKVKSILLTIGFSALIAGPILAQVPSGSQMPQTAPGSQQPPNPGMERIPGANSPDTAPVVDPMAVDRSFVRQAAQGSATEVALGKLAEEKGASDTVKQFGKRIADDQGKAVEELKQAAGTARLEVPSEMPKKAKKAQDKLSKLSGADFDREYAKMMVSDNKDQVKAFEREAHDGSVAPVKDFAAKTLPTLQDHLKAAEQLLASAGKGSDTSSR